LQPRDRRSRARVRAGGAWAAVFAQAAAEDDVIAVADELLACGENWEASRLLGQAALDEADPQAARRLLERARTTGVDVVEEGGTDGLAALGLSDREAEVAVLVVEGRTHKEIGAQLYISPKTVEHHVAKIRQKVGATSRAELLGIVRDALA
ncbi:MAG: helix-turn-helix transcriptional regulator, partial [Actinomycetota bacterium]